MVMEKLNAGDFVLIHYPTMNKLAMFLIYDGGVYTFKDKSGVFGVTEKYKNEYNVEFEIIADD